MKRTCLLPETMRECSQHVELSVMHRKKEFLAVPYSFTCAERNFRGLAKATGAAGQSGWQTEWPMVSLYLNELLNYKV